ncbi:BON domain-containing protein [Tumidithrix elongata RA019]|uniref:BON domain-containing protein n=1 Tax=Tumidithrix elongata BACA0141 TaxID=2716417 RepID=A0AAW9PRS4_9CYAN|nr:BON domain-containing protein [Tumidithrix elongata RA019]
MKKIARLVLSSILLMGTVACYAEVPTTTVQNSQNDAPSKVRQDQLDSDIRAREQRNKLTGGDTNRADSDLTSEVRSKLEANIPNGNLTITSKEGTVVVSGTVQTQSQLDKIEPLAKQIKGVKSVYVGAKVMTIVLDKKQ